MKILYLHQYFKTPSMSGGTRSYEMARRMVAKGHIVHLITSCSDPKNTAKVWKSEVIEGIKVYSLNLPYDNSMGFYNRVCAFFTFAIKATQKAKSIKADLLFATSTPLTIAIPAVFAKKHLNIPMVFEVRDLWPQLPIAIGALKSPITKFLATKLETWAYKNSDAIVGLSPGMCEGIINTGYPAALVHNIPNSCDNDLFMSANYQDYFANQFKWLEDKPLVLYAGTLGKINGVSYLVKLACQMKNINPNVQFIVIGNGAEYDVVKNLAIELGVLNNNFYMLDSIPKTDVAKWFLRATVSTSLFINLPEMWANSANKFFDSLAAGKPLAINYKGWQYQLLKEHKNGIYLDAQNIELASRTLNDFIGSKEQLERASHCSKELALKTFSRDILANKLITVLERVVNND